jgi:hypothetical protein
MGRGQVALSTCLLVLGMQADGLGNAAAADDRRSDRDVVVLKASPRLPGPERSPADEGPGSEPVPMPRVRPAEPGPVPIPRIHPYEPGPVPMPQVNPAEPRPWVLPGPRQGRRGDLVDRLRLR